MIFSKSAYQYLTENNFKISRKEYYKDGLVLDHSTCTQHSLVHLAATTIAIGGATAQIHWHALPCLAFAGTRTTSTSF